MPSATKAAPSKLEDGETRCLVHDSHAESAVETGERRDIPSCHGWGNNGTFSLALWMSYLGGYSTQAD